MGKWDFTSEQVLQIQLDAKEAAIEALDKENIVMRQQMVKLIDERDALLAQLEKADALADEVLDHTEDSHYLRIPLEAYKEARHA